MLRNIMDSTPYNIILISPDYKILNFNKSVAQAIHLTYERNIQIGEDFRQYIIPGDEAEFDEDFKRALSGQEVCKEWLLDAKGQYLWFEIRHFPVRDERGEVIGISFNSTDIHTRKTTEEKLRTSEAQLRSLVDSQTNYLIRTDTEGRYTYANQAFLDNFRYLYNGQDMIGQNSMPSICEEDHPKVLDAIAHLFEYPRDILQVELSKPERDGQKKTSLWEFSCITAANGQPSEIQCIGLDITDRKEAERKLSESEAYHRSLLASIPDMVFVLDKNYRFLDFKASNKDLYVEPEAFLGKTIDELMPSEVGQLHKNAVLEAYQTQEVVEVRYSISVQGEDRHFRSRTVTFGQDKTVTVITDISQSVYSRQKIEAQNKQLTHFTHIVSHNLRSSVSNMQGLLGVLEAEEPDIFQNTYIQLFAQVAHKLNETIQHLNQVLDINFQVSAQEKTTVYLHQMVTDTMLSISFLAKEAQVELINQVPEDVQVFVVPAYMESIILNFLTNGIKYRSKRKKSYVSVSATEDQAHVYIKVEDNGLGIDLKTHGEKVFGMYKTFHEHPEAKGIGLFLTKSQVDAMGGHIDVQSTVNLGTIFTVRLPKK